MRSLGEGHPERPDMPGPDHKHKDTENSSLSQQPLEVSDLALALFAKVAHYVTFKNTS